MLIFIYDTLVCMINLYGKCTCSIYYKIYIYIYPFVVIIILKYSTIHVKYFKFDLGSRNKNKQGAYLIFPR